MASSIPATHLKDGIGAMTDARVASFFDKMVRAGVVHSDIDFRKGYTLRFINKGVGLDLRPKDKNLERQEPETQWPIPPCPKSLRTRPASRSACAA